MEMGGEEGGRSRWDEWREKHGIICTTRCKIQTVNGNLLYDSGNTDRGSVTT